MQIVLIGGGKMGTALARKLSNTIKDLDLRVLEPNDTAWDALRNSIGENTRLHRIYPNTPWIDTVDVIILAVKPQQMDDVLKQIGKLSIDKLVISVAAGIPLSRIEQALGERARCVRVMPNTPMLVGEGFSGYTLSSRCKESDEVFLKTLLNGEATILGGIGSKAVQIEERLMDAITALSGSGPAYVFHFIHALIEGGKELGLEEAIAREAALWTVSGALAMVRTQPQRNVLDLARDVKSPGGTTEAACDYLEQNNWQQILISAMKAAEARSKLLSHN
jgi:pyrroline-5-carboxylate reductase